MSLMVFFSHPSERLDQKALKRERARAQLAEQTEEEEESERERERQTEIFFRSKKAHSIYSYSCVRRRFFWVRTNQPKKTTKKTKEKADVSS
jgi:uncharacterized protein YdaU (DUF1376 family)